ncbi:30S ribosome-binding factor RbfA [Methylocella sp. CPCC 101449]|uniref:30S ribosome-binding factor RbfA n=1 Tax=Methylocella sp. CPCC 101449 TaxID=2987531 RepID=UPI00288EC668|nr:30S ribosome-binding factor RbfA [Methylocella sp. CPCC 101449]MDT2020333.1 30S ribosome-binding factor RbfA [Methylocella sp. CPCC 101449]
MSRNHQKGGEPSQRMLRVGELVRHAMSELLARGALNDAVLDAHVVTVPKVKMSPDLKLATIFIMPLGGKDATEVLKALDHHKKFLRGEVARKINLKFAPEVRFKVDDSFDNSARIDALLNSPRVRQDLNQDLNQDSSTEDPAAEDGSAPPPDATRREP